jgi:hypothetical protein
MWWDWTEITLLDSVLFSILSVSILYLVGSGVLRLICTLSKKADPFGSFDFLVKTNFRIVFGFIFIFLFLMIFSAFNLPFSTSVLLVVLIALIGFVATRQSLKLRLLKKIRLQDYAPIIAVFLMILTTFFLSTSLIAGFYGSTNDDGADHTLLVRIVLDNPNSLLTRNGQPYLNFVLNYPSGTHVLSAFLLTLLNVPIQKIIILVSAILPGLIALSFFTTTKCLFKNKALSILALIISAFFTIGLSWAPFSWGGLPLLLSFYLVISGMGLIYLLLIKEKMVWLNASLMGLIFFIASQTYPTALLIVFFWFLLMLIVKLLPKSFDIRGIAIFVSSSFSRKNMVLIVAFVIPLLFSVPYFFSYYVNNIAGPRFNVVNSSLNSVANVSSEIVRTRISFNWLFDLPALSQFFSEFGKLLSLASFSLILLVLLCVLMVWRRITSVLPSKEFSKGLLLIYLFMLIIMSYLAITLFLSINLFSNLFDPARVWQHIFIAATIMTALVIFSAIYFSYETFNRLFRDRKKNGVKIAKTRFLTCVVSVFLIFSVAAAIIPAIAEQQEIYNKVGSSFNMYETLNEDDMFLMKWITENVPSQVHILVSSGDSGQFVTSVTQRQTISVYSFLKNYTDLMRTLTSNSSDLRAIPLMLEYNVSYVYIGSVATTYALQIPYYRSFNSTQFLETPYFTLAKEVGDAWLFKFNASAALSAYTSLGLID